MSSTCNTNNPINNILRLIRECHDLDVEFLASELQITEEEINNFEKGVSRVTDGIIHLYAVYFDIPKQTIAFFCNERNVDCVTKPMGDFISKLAISFLEKKIKNM